MLKEEDLNFREMRHEDLEKVVQIEAESFSSPWSYSIFDYEISQNDLAHYLVALLGGEIVGYAGFWVVMDTAHITNIAVAPHHRRKKYGAQLLLETMRRAWIAGACKITLEVRVSNHSAISLYSAFGFKERGRRKRYYADNEDALIMWQNNLSYLITNFDKIGGF